jgi:pyridoxamine-phosphate oxidase
VEIEPIETLSGDAQLDLPEFDDPPADPLELLAGWLKSARERGVREPQALALATADAEGTPSVRVVLLKQAGDALVFNTDSRSRKGRDLAARPWAAGTLYWRETLQQVTIEGPVRQMSEAESDALFAARPRAAQAASVASGQGEALDDPGGLKARAAELAAGDEALSRPPHWSGYELTPERLEFWHGSGDRLHRRLLYERSGGGEWSARRLSP